MRQAELVFEGVAKKQKRAILHLLTQLEVDPDLIEKLVRERYGVWLDDLNGEQRGNIIRKLSAATRALK